MSNYEAIGKLTAKTEQNIIKVYTNLMAKYANKNQKIFSYNKHYYYNSLKRKKDDTYFGLKDFLIDIDFPYPDDVMQYIQSIDIMLDHEYALERFKVKINNELSGIVSHTIDEYLNSLYKEDFYNSSSLLSEEERLAIHILVKNSPEALIASKYFAAQNLLLGI